MNRCAYLHAQANLTVIFVLLTILCLPSSREDDPGLRAESSEWINKYMVKTTNCLNYLITPCKPSRIIVETQVRLRYDLFAGNMVLCNTLSSQAYRRKRLFTIGKMYFRLVTFYRALIYLNTKQPVGTDGKANLPSVNIEVVRPYRWSWEIRTPFEKLYSV